MRVIRVTIYWEDGDTVSEIYYSDRAVNRVVNLVQSLTDPPVRIEVVDERG